MVSPDPSEPAATGGHPKPIITTNPVALEEEGLRDIVARQFPDGNVYIGAASHHRLLGTETERILNREFGYVTPANAFKQHNIHPTSNVWQWERSDEWLQHCAENNQVMRLHSPISPQCSQWAKDDNRSPEELKTNLEEYMTALCQRYNGHPNIKWMDVVNETVETNGEWFGPKEGTEKWENPWPIIGYDNSDPLGPPLYIKYAFQIADNYAPDIKLIINQHGGMEDVAWNKIKGLVTYLRGQGLRVDGIGWQAHIDAGWEDENGNLKALRSLIDWAHANQLEFHVTENNVWLKQKDDWQKQAATFSAIVSVLLEKRESGVVTWNLWHIRDSEPQNKEWNGCMFFDDYEPKPAYYAIQNLLVNPPAVSMQPN